jgi:hypothetical protein
MNNIKPIFINFFPIWLLNGIMGLLVYYIFIINLGKDGFSNFDVLLLLIASGFLFFISITIVNTILLNRYHEQNITNPLSLKTWQLFFIISLGIIALISMIDYLIQVIGFMDFTDFKKAFSHLLIEEGSDNTEIEELEAVSPFYLSMLSNIAGVILGVIFSIIISNKIIKKNHKI